MELTRDTIEKRFIRYVLPSIFTQLLSAFYTVADGFFVGQATSDTGLAAINLAWPVAAIMMGTSIGIGTGGAVLASTRMGEGDKEGALRARGTTMVMLLLAGIFFVVTFNLLLPVFLTLLGAEGAVREASKAYLRVMILGCPIQMFSGGLVPMLRNFGHTVSMMVVMIVSGGINITLDPFFIGTLGLGAGGAALATVISQSIVLITCIVFMVKDKEYPVSFRHLNLSGSTAKSIFSIGLSPFGLFIAPSITLLFTNHQCLRYGGDEALAAYAVAAYVVGAVAAFLSGIGEGIQPLISYAEGAKDHAAAKRILHRAMRWCISLSVILCIVSILGRGFLGDAFKCSETAKGLLNHTMICTAVAFPLLGLCKLLSSYFYASGAQKYSTFLIYIDPLCVAPILLMLLPRFFDIDGIWISYPITYVIVFALCLKLFFEHERKKKQLMAAEENR